MKDFYLELGATKSGWQIIHPQANKVTPGAESTIGRALALANLEIPVGNFVTQASKKELPLSESAINLLLSNVQDEIKHDQQLKIADATYNLTTDEDRKVAQQLLEKWLELDDHPIVKAMVIERSIFFIILPLLRFFGDTGLRTIASDISGDEQIHVAANTQVCKELTLTYSKKADRLRRETVAFMCQKLNVPNNPKGNMGFWLRQSTKLLEEGQAEELKETSRARIISMFECNNSSLPEY